RRARAPRLGPPGAVGPPLPGARPRSPGGPGPGALGACVSPWPPARMQDTAEGFGQPIRHIFASAFRIDRELPSPWDAAPRYRIHIEDRIWRALYLPLASGVRRLGDAIAVLQGGRLAVYLLYSFLTLIALLVFVL